MAKQEMNKAAMIAQMASVAGINKVQAQKALESLVDLCRKEVKAGRPVRLPGLGTLSLRKSKARKGTNPATGQPMTIPASKRMAFKQGTLVNRLLNPGK